MNEVVHNLFSPGKRMGSTQFGHGLDPDDGVMSTRQPEQVQLAPSSCAEAGATQPHRGRQIDPSHRRKKGMWLCHEGGMGCDPAPAHGGNEHGLAQPSPMGGKEVCLQV